MKKIGVALLGVGTVGGGTYTILKSMRETFKEKYQLDIEVLHVIDKNLERVKELGIDPKIVSTDINNVVNNQNIHIVCEFFGGIEPAKSFSIAALKAGKSVVTANKEMFAKNWIELESAAKEGNAGLYFEATSVGGVPIVRVLNESMQGNEILSIQGIFNGTTNFILSKMIDEGLEYKDVLKEAQELGYAEADPTADVEGYDSMYKLSILSTLAFGRKVPIEKIYREGITKINKIDIEYGKKFGYTLKLLATAQMIDGKLEARVHPTFVGNNNPLASVKGSFNAVLLKGNNVGEIMLYGRGAGALPTGSAIVSDIIYAAQQIKHKLIGFSENKFFDDDSFAKDFSCEYFIRMNVVDKPGVLAKITKVFGENNVSINSMEQTAHGGTASLIFMIHKTPESLMKKSIDQMKNIDVINSIDAVIRVM
ncbi:MAG: homoserine dehydrogenase [Christensenellales bacterium]|jgi:homoserine dehydrogenase|nr:homoserine dehydrogenase [Clostridiales bacterium]